MREELDGTAILAPDYKLKPSFQLYYSRVYVPVESSKV